MRNNKGQFKKGFTWRQPKPYWDRDWLFNQYITMGKSAEEISKEQLCKCNNIYYFLNKFNIPIRTISEARKLKYWGQFGSDNPMWNRFGELNHRWQGGITSERQAFYQSREWKNACSKVWGRDKGICQRCLIKKDGGMPFHIHHKKSFKDKELRADVDNLILLCEACHQWVHSKGNVENDFIQ
jgi:5-methylcytosine-specific restriction enzyme A